MRSPSLTARLTTRPVVSAVMLTRRLGWILPDADTIASRSRVLTVSVVTVTPFSRLKYRLAPTMAAATRTTAIPMSTFFRDIESPYDSAERTAAIARTITKYKPSSDVAIGPVFLLYNTARPIDSVTSHQI